MIFKILLSEYSFESKKKSLRLLRAIKTYIYSRDFRIHVDVKHMCMVKNRSRKKKIKNKLLKKYGCDIGLNAKIGDKFSMPHPAGVVIGDRVIIGDFCTIYQNSTIGQKNGQYPVIGNNVTIYPSSVIIGGINIGDNSIIGAGSIVMKDVNHGAVVAGNPARLLRLNNE